MAEPTSALSYYDLILRVAREAGIAYYGSAGDEPAMIPVDAHDLDLCKKIVNDAIRMFIADAPPKGWRWMRRIMSVVLTATRVTGTVDSIPVANQLTDATLITTYTAATDLVGWWIYILTGTGIGSYAQITAYDETTGTITVADWLDAYGNPGGTDPVATDTFAITPVETVNGDIHRYPLAENFGGEVNGEIHYEANTNHAAIIDWRDEAYIRNRRAVTVITGYPQFAAVRPLEFASGGTGPKRRWELIVNPDPVAIDTLEFPYTLFFDELRLIGGLATNGAATAVSDSSLANIYPNNLYNGWTCYIISGTGKGAMGVVTNYVGADGEFFVADWLYSDGTAAVVNPASGSAYYLEPPGNLHPAGLKFDEAVKASCLAQAEIEVEDIQAGFVTKYNQKALPKAFQADLRTAPRTLGSMDHRKRYIRERTWRDITTDHDV